MSRAFVKEVDDAPEPPLPDRPVSTAPNIVTKRGAAMIEEALDTLRERLPELDGTDAEEARRDIRYWEARRATMQVVERDPEAEEVGFGAEIVIMRMGKTQTLKIVGEDEADPDQGYLAYTAPLAKALEGAIARDVVEFDSGGRSTEIEIVSVRSV